MVEAFIKENFIHIVIVLLSLCAWFLAKISDDSNAIRKVLESDRSDKINERLKKMGR